MNLRWWDNELIIQPFIGGRTKQFWTANSHTKRNILQILLNQSEILLILPFPDWFETKRTFVWFQIHRKIINTIWFLFDLIRFGKYFPVSMRCKQFGTLCCWPVFPSMFEKASAAEKARPSCWKAIGLENEYIRKQMTLI